MLFRSVWLCTKFSRLNGTSNLELNSATRSVSCLPPPLVKRMKGIECLLRNRRVEEAPGRLLEERRRTPSISKAKAKSGGTGSVVLLSRGFDWWRNCRACLRCVVRAGDAEATERRTGRPHVARKIGRVRPEEQTALERSNGFMIYYNSDNANGCECQRDGQERDGPCP